MRLATIAPNGGRYFTHDDIDECRAFLRDHGLECEGTIGWESDKYRGAIYFDGLLDRNGKSNGLNTWTAGYWDKDK